MTTTLTELDEEALVQILCELKNALTKQYAALFEIEDTELEFREDVSRAIAKKAMERKRVLVVCVLSWGCSTRNHVRTAIFG